MVTNITPQYSKAEEEYRRAQSTAEKIACLEKMLVLLPKHKASEKLQADLKTRLRLTREELDKEKRTAKKVGKSYEIPRQGAGQVVILGGPNAGKSRIVKELTNAEPDVAPYPFTTREPLPGMMAWEDTSVQLIDTPPITDTHFESYLINILRGADLVLLAFDGSSDDAPEQTLQAIQQIHERHTKLSDHTGFDPEDMGVVHLRTLLLVTRGNAPGVEDRLAFFQEMFPHSYEVIRVELDDVEEVTKLRNRIYRELGVIRVYSKSPGKPADYRDPYILPEGGTVEDLAGKIHKDLAEKVKCAKIWGTSARDGQTVSKDHVLADRDLVEIHT
ncbi:MAG: TGS domain-containing protein [Planctomycetales bacterium]